MPLLETMPFRRPKLTALALVASVLGGPAFGQSLQQPAGQPALPSNAMQIAAVVNEDIITVYDVQARTGVFIATSGLDNSPEMQRRLLRRSDRAIGSAPPRFPRPRASARASSTANGSVRSNTAIRSRACAKSLARLGPPWSNRF